LQHVSALPGHYKEIHKKWEVQSPQPNITGMMAASREGQNM
jgi:hypothetical protein